MAMEANTDENVRSGELFDELPLPEHGQAAAGKTPAASASASARARVIRPNREQIELRPMDLESRCRWELYTKAKEEMLERTHIPEAPWWVVEAVDKKRARLNCIHHMLNQIPYREVEHPAVVLPPRERKPDYHRNPIPAEMFVPAVY